MRRTSQIHVEALKASASTYLVRVRFEDADGRISAPSVELGCHVGEACARSAMRAGFLAAKGFLTGHTDDNVAVTLENFPGET